MKIMPLAKPPKRKLYIYTRHLCSECGCIHLYKKSDVQEGVTFGCAKDYQLGFLPEDKLHQLFLIEK